MVKVLTPTAASSTTAAGSTEEKEPTEDVIEIPANTPVDFFIKKGKFSKEGDIFLIKEVLLQKPFQHKSHTVLRSKAWEKVVESLKSSGVRVSTRCVKDRYNILIERFKKKNSRELRASGIEVEYDELDNLLQDAVDMERDLCALREEQTQKQEQDRKTAELMRKRCLETMKDDECYVSKKKRCNKTESAESNTSYIVDYLEAKKGGKEEEEGKKYQLKEKKLKLKEKELELKERELNLKEEEINQSKEIINSLSKMIILQQQTIDLLSK